MSRDVASVTIVGRAGNNPQVAVGTTGERVNFRVIATERRFDKALDGFVDGDQFGVTVVCWKTLASAVLNSVRKGDPVLVSGRIATRRFEKNGATQYFTEVKADFVGFDVSKAGSRFSRKAFEPVGSSDAPGEPAGEVDGGDRTSELGVQSLTARSLAEQKAAVDLGSASAQLDEDDFDPDWDDDGAGPELEPALAAQ
ncbi:MAG: single-stranded DNA-binding protein [Nakamurella sp.]